MINQLNQVDQEEWPEILVKRLSQYRNQNTDNFYKNKVTNIRLKKQGEEFQRQIIIVHLIIQAAIVVVTV